MICEYMCAEPRCGLRFASPQKYDIHWTQSHKTKPRQKCPSYVKVKPVAPKNAPYCTFYTNNRPDCNGFIRVIDAIATSMQVHTVEAKRIYKNIFRHPDVVKRGYLSHRFDSNTRQTIAVIQDKDWSDFRSLISLLITQSHEDIKRVKVESTTTASPTVLPKLEPFAPLIYAQQKKRKHTTQVDPTTDLYAHISLIQNIQSRIDSYSSLVCEIKKMDCDDSMKDILRFETAKAIGCTKDYTPVVIIGNIVHEYLGYSPSVLSADVSSKLLMSIGRIAKVQYISRHGKAPKRRKYSSGGYVMETNNYSTADKVWIDRIVKDECAKIGVYPRPRVSMARGEKLISGLNIE
jgi:hypothetical protein